MAGSCHGEEIRDTEREEEDIEVGEGCFFRKRNSRIAPAPAPPNSLNFGFLTLPQELSLLIMEYYVTSLKDLFLLGFICQSWRMTAMISPLWRKYDHPSAPVAAAEAGNLVSALPVSEIRRRILDEYRSQYERRKKLHMKSLFETYLFGIYLFLCLSSLICFGNYSTLSSTLFQNLGCISFYIGLPAFTILFNLSQDSIPSRLLITSSNFIFLFTIFFLHWKLLSPHSLQWIGVISPLWFFFLNIPLWIVTRSYSCYTNLKLLIRYFTFFPPPIMGLYLYCRSLDHNSDLPRGIICLVLPPKLIIDYFSLVQIFTTFDQISQVNGWSVDSMLTSLSLYFYLGLVSLGATSTQFFIFRVVEYWPSPFFIFLSLGCFGGILFVNPRLRWDRPNELDIFWWLSAD
jgi:hypothetical protein